LQKKAIAYLEQIGMLPGPTEFLLTVITAVTLTILLMRKLKGRA